MPGHKYGRGASLSGIPMHLLDATEASGLDNLYEAEGIIKEAMALMAQFYGSRETLFVTNGSTGGILASILAVCKPGDKLIVARNAHHSVWSALTLSGVQPIYVLPDKIESINVMGSIATNTIRQALEENPDAIGAIIVSPTYEGMISPINEIAECLHSKEKVLIVDEAHGAHFVLDKAFPKSSLYLGADIVIQSMHKTLPTLTQSALLHIGTNKIEPQALVEALRMVQTSSPSYMMMGVMDYTRAYIENHKEEIRAYISNLIETRKQLKNLHNLALFQVDDISKIIIETTKTNFSGYELGRRLEEKYKIGIEAAHEKHIILMSTFADTKDRLDYLVKSIREIDKSINGKTEPINLKNEVIQYNKSIVTGISPRVVYFSTKEWVTLDEGIGRISAKNIMLYPPGIPVVCMGEKITQDLVFQINLEQEKLLGIRLNDKHILVEVVIEAND